MVVYNPKKSPNPNTVGLSEEGEWPWTSDPGNVAVHKICVKIIILLVRMLGS